jgi:spore coat polysaccharide biosynthesis predicted glycosyltransferase SpsG
VNLLIVVEANDKIGIGHLTRVNLLAVLLKDRGHLVSISSLHDSDSEFIDNFISQNSSLRCVESIENVTNTFFGSYDLVIFDILSRTEANISSQGKTSFIEIINDSCNFPHFDFFLTLGPKKRNFQPINKPYFYGPEYVVTSNKYTQKYFWSPNYTKLIMCFGSTLGQRSFENVIKSVRKSPLSDSIITVYTKSELGVTHLFQENTNIAKWNQTTFFSDLTQSDLLICTASTVFWEGLKIGIPMLVTKIAENQSDIFDFAKKLGYPTFEFERSDTCLHQLETLNPINLNTLARQSLALVSNDGAEKVVRLLERIFKVEN